MAQVYFDDASVEEAWDSLYRHIGEIVVTINTAHWLVFEMMGILLNTSRDDTAPIYYSLKADAAQRDLTVAIAVDLLTEPEEADLRVRIVSAINDLGKASGIRNAFIHTHWTMQSSLGDDSRHMFSAEGKPHPKLILEDPLRQASEFQDTLVELIDRLYDLCGELEGTPSVRQRQRRTGPRHNSRESPDRA